MKKLVSIVTPCYNGEKFIDIYMKSLLSQDYDNCQLIFVDDGSEDNSKSKFYEYKKELEKKGFLVEYYFQKNSGQAVAVANGLKYVCGDYLIWPDVDDLLTKDSISKKVRFLEEHKKYSIVRTDYKTVHENDINHVIELSAQKYPYSGRSKEDLFMDYLIGENMWLQPGCFMIRMEMFDKANPDRYIYPTRSGQNWQMLLPVLYYGKCGYINENLYIYVKHEESHSDDRNNSYKQQIARCDKYEELIINTIKHMELKDENVYLSLVRSHYCKMKLDLAFEYRKQNDAILFYKGIKMEERPSFKIYLKALGSHSEFLHKIVNIKRDRMIERSR